MSPDNQTARPSPLRPTELNLNRPGEPGLPTPAPVSTTANTRQIALGRGLDVGTANLLAAG